MLFDCIWQKAFNDKTVALTQLFWSQSETIALYHIRRIKSIKPLYLTHNAKLADIFENTYIVYFTTVRPINFIIFDNITNYLYCTHILLQTQVFRTRIPQIVLLPLYLRVWWIRAYVCFVIAISPFWLLCHSTIVFIALCFLDNFVACLIPSSIIVPVCLSSFNVTCFLSSFSSYILHRTLNVPYTCDADKKITKRKIYFRILMYLCIRYLYWVRWLTLYTSYNIKWYFFSLFRLVFFAILIRLYSLFRHYLLMLSLNLESFLWLKINKWNEM